MNYQMAGDFPICDYGDFKFVRYKHFNAKPLSDFRLDIEITSDHELKCFWTYDTSLYTSAAISSLATMFSSLIQSILSEQENVTIGSLEILGACNQTLAPDVCRSGIKRDTSLKRFDGNLFPDLLSRAIAAQPLKAAIIDSTRTITYSELDLYTSRVASHFAQTDVEVGSAVGLYCYSSANMVIAIYGILRAGLSYIPISPEFPEGRIQTMVTTADVCSVLSDRITTRQRFRLLEAGILSDHIQSIDDLISESRDLESLKAPGFKKYPGNFCCIFTSGTTGQPKGITIGHKQIRYQMDSYHNFLGTTDSDRLLLTSAHIFDMSLTSIYGAILQRATVLIAPREGELYSSLQQRRTNT